MFGLRVHQGNAQSPSGLAQIFSSLSKSRHNKNVHFRLILFLHANTKERRRRLLMDVLHLMKEKGQGNSAPYKLFNYYTTDAV
jgi:hypothetical protein